MEIIRKTIILTVITSIAAVFLAVTYGNTKPKIDAYMKSELAVLRKSVLPGVARIEEIKIQDLTCFQGYDDKNIKTGLIIPLSVKGYSGGIEMLLGVGLEGNIAGLCVVKQTETPGLGNKIALPEFTGQFTGLTETWVNLKKDSPEGKIDGITAATISSRSVTGGVRYGLQLFNEYMNYTSRRDILNRIPDGSYRGRGEGFTGPVIVEVVVEASRIRAIRVIKQQEAKQYWAKVKARLPARILEEQTTEVDSVSGATLTSRGLIRAVQNALESAGGK